VGEPHQRGADQRLDSAAGDSDGSAQNLFVPSQPFGDVASDQPEVFQRQRNVCRFVAPAAFDEPRHRDAIVLEIVADAIQPFDLRRTDQPVARQISLGRAIARQSLHRVFTFTALNELEGRIRPHGFEHSVQGASGHGARRPQQEAFVHDSGDGCQRFLVSDGNAIVREHRSGGSDRESTRQRAESAERALLIGAEQLIAPGDGRIHRLLTFGKIARADRREQDVLLKALEQTVEREQLGPWRRELERERQSVEPPANRRHRGAVARREPKVRLHVANTFREQPHRRTSRQIRRRRSGGFSSHASGPTTYSRSPRRRRGARLVMSSCRQWNACEKFREQRRRIEDMFEIVEHQQRR
jgi:hypothetical protein